MSDAPVHMVHGRLLTVLCGAEEIGAAVVWFPGSDVVPTADCEICLRRVPAALKREEERTALLGRKPAPRPLREGETLGRAGRLDDEKPVKVSRVRDMTAADLRRVSLDGGAESGDPMLEVAERAPLRCEETGEVLPHIPWVGDDDNRGLQHNDGQSEPRPPREWEESNARERDVEFYFDRQQMNEDARATREALPLFERLRHVVQEIGTYQTQKAQQRRETDAKGAGDGSGGAPSGDGAGAIGYLDPRQVDGRLLQIRLQVEALEEALDAHKGYAVKDYALMTSAEKDTILTGPRLRGLSPEAIHAIHPELGAPKWISRVRGQADQDRLGHPKPPKSDEPKRAGWTDDDNHLVLHSTLPDEQLAERLGRTANAIRIQRNRLGGKASAAA